MPRDVRAYLHDMIDSCQNIAKLTSAATIDEYLSNDQLRWAVERQLSILGEALYQVRMHFPDTANKIQESRAIINFRHVLIHGYAHVQDDVVWGIVDSKISPLCEELNTLFSTFPKE